MSDTGWNISQAGSLITIVTFIGGVFTFSGSPLVDKFGIKKTAIISMVLMGVGNAMVLITGNNYIFNMVARAIMGFGSGAMVNIPVILISVWFPGGFQSTLQGIRASVLYAGIALLLIKSAYAAVVAQAKKTC